MRLLRFLARLSNGTTLLVVLVSLGAGGCSTALLAILNRALAEDGSLALLAVAFLGAALLKVGSSFWGEILLLRIGARTTARLKDSLVRQISTAHLRRIEGLGSGRLLSLLTDDIEAIQSAYVTLPYVSAQVAMLVGGAAYLAWLSPPALLALLAFATVAIASQRAALALSHRHWEEARSCDDRLLEHYRGLIDGLKQLKLHRGRRESFVADEIAKTTQKSLDLNVSADVRYSIAEHVTQLSLYTLLGIVLFALPELVSIDRSSLTAYVLTIVFLMGPLRALLKVYGQLVATDIAVVRLEALTAELENLAQQTDLTTGSKEPMTFSRIELDGTTMSYAADGDDARFRLGPVHASVEPGDLLFVVGGNGSGKTTLAKVLCGLYEPDGGRVVWDGVTVDGDNRDDFRQLFSGVFADQFLFDRPVTRSSRGERISQELSRFGLSHRVQFHEGRFHGLDLSRGQRARLLLLSALLEDRPVYVFDEWAAEQDPGFRRRFYEELLPELKNRGKTVIVITHDDRYFHLADRVWRLEEGRCEELSPGAQRAASAS